LPKQEYAKILDESQNKFKQHGCDYVLHFPEEVSFDGATAKVVIGRAFSCKRGQPKFSTLHITFIKNDGAWTMKEMLNK